MVGVGAAAGDAGAAGHQQQHHHLPEDRYHLVYCIFFAIGAGNLMAWNSMISATKYHETRFCGTAAEDDYESVYAVSYMSCNLFFLLLASKFQNIMPLKWRVAGSLGGFAAVMGVAMLLVALHMPGSTVFALSVLLISSAGVFDAVFASGGFGVAGIFPPVYTQALMGGQGLAGLLAAFTNILTVYTVGKDDICDDDDDDDDDNDDGDDDSCEAYSFDAAAFVFFLVVFIVLIGCVLAFLGLEHLPFAEHYLAQRARAAATAHHAREADHIQLIEGSVGSNNSSSNSSSGEGVAEGGLMIVKAAGSRTTGTRLGDHDGDRVGGGDESRAPVGTIESRGGHVGGEDADEDEEDDVDPDQIRASLDEGELLAAHLDIPSWAELREVLWSVRVQAASVWFVFVVTIGLFPGITSKLESTERCSSGNNRFHDDLFVPFLFLVFNLADFIGRSSAGWVQLVPPEHIWIPSAARIVFFPLFLLCKIEDSQTATVFAHDAWPILFMFLFALSNGYTASLAMMYGPTQVQGTSKRELAGTIMILTLTIGLLCGSGISFLSLYAATGRA